MVKLNLDSFLSGLEFSKKFKTLQSHKTQQQIVLQAPQNKIEIYQAKNGSSQIEIKFDNETLWMSLNQIAQLFDRDKSVISRHLKNIFAEEELEKKQAVAFFATTGSDQKIYQVEYFNLDAIISVGYRVIQNKLPN